MSYTNRAPFSGSAVFSAATVSVERGTRVAIRQCVRRVTSILSAGLARASQWLALSIVLVFLPASIHAFTQERTVPIPDRARGAERVVVGRVQAVEPSWRVNEYGDRLIVSTVHVTSDETLKGPFEASFDVEVEGGTIDGLTLAVSDLPTFAPGDRAVFFVRRDSRGSWVPSLRGQSLLLLDSNDRVVGTGANLDDIRRAVVAAR